MSKYRYWLYLNGSATLFPLNLIRIFWPSVTRPSFTFNVTVLVHENALDSRASFLTRTANDFVLQSEVSKYLQAPYFDPKIIVTNYCLIYILVKSNRIYIHAKCNSIQFKICKTWSSLLPENWIPCHQNSDNEDRQRQYKLHLLLIVGKMGKKNK